MEAVTTAAVTTMVVVVMLAKDSTVAVAQLAEAMREVPLADMVAVVGKKVSARVEMDS